MVESESPLTPLQVAIYDRLRTDPELINLLGDEAVYDQVPEDAPKPYLVIGDHLSTPDNAHGQFGREVTETLHVWTAVRGNVSGQAIAARAIALLDHQPDALQPIGHRVVTIRHEFDQALKNPDPQIRHHIIRFRIQTEQQEG